jgi:hypothetical protein
MKRLSTLALLILACGCKSKEPPPLPPLPPPTQAIPATQPGMTPHPTAAGGPAITFTAPAGWSAHPPTSPMRKAQFVLPGKAKGEEAELIVFHFPGTGGGVQDNLSRWYTQFKQPDGSDSAKRAETRKQTVNGIEVTTVYLVGTYMKPKSPMAMGGPTVDVPNQALLAAIAESPGGHWFFKAVGPKETIDAQRAAFDEFVKSFRRKP